MSSHLINLLFPPMFAPRCMEALALEISHGAWHQWRFSCMDKNTVFIASLIIFDQEHSAHNFRKGKQNSIMFKYSIWGLSVSLEHIANRANGRMC